MIAWILLSTALVPRLAGAAAVHPVPAAAPVASVETRAVLTVRGVLRLAHHHQRIRRPVSDGFAQTRRTTVLATTDGIPTRLRVTYLAVHRRVTAPGVPPEAAGRTFVVSRQGGHFRVTEQGKEVKVYLAAEIAHDLRDRMARDPFVAAASPRRRPGQAVPLDPGYLARLLALGSHTRVTFARLTLRRAFGGRALLGLTARIGTRLGGLAATGTLSGPVVVDTVAHRLSWLRLDGGLAGRGTVTLDLGGGPAKRPKPSRDRKVRAKARVRVRLRFSLVRRVSPAPVHRLQSPPGRTGGHAPAATPANEGRTR